MFSLNHPIVKLTFPQALSSIDHIHWPAKIWVLPVDMVERFKVWPRGSASDWAFKLGENVGTKLHFLISANQPVYILQGRGRTKNARRMIYQVSLKLFNVSSSYCKIEYNPLNCYLLNIFQQSKSSLFISTNRYQWEIVNRHVHSTKKWIKHQLKLYILMISCHSKEPEMYIMVIQSTTFSKVAIRLSFILYGGD